MRRDSSREAGGGLIIGHLDFGGGGDLHLQHNSKEGTGRLTSGGSVRVRWIEHVGSGRSGHISQGGVLTVEGSEGKVGGEVGETRWVLGVGANGDHVVIKVALVVEIEADNHQLLVVTSEVDPETEVGGTLLTLLRSCLLVGGLSGLNVVEGHAVGDIHEVIEGLEAGGGVDGHEVTILISLVLEGHEDTLEEDSVLHVVLQVDDEVTKGTKVVSGKGLNHTPLVNTMSFEELSQCI